MLLRIAAITLLGIASPSFAQGVGGSIAVTSDYVYRGVTQSRGELAVQADLHYASPQGWSAGLWASTVELNWWDGRTVELNGYLGLRWQIDRDWSSKISAVHYEYPWNNSNVRYNYDEVVGTIGYRNRVFVTAAWSFNTSRYTTRGYAKDRDAFSYEIATAWPLVKSFSLNAGVGYYDLRDVIDAGYVYWNAGLSFDFRSWRADLGYIGTQDRADRLFYGRIAGERLVGSLSWRF